MTTTDERPAAGANRPFQFSLRGLLLVMVAFAIGLALIVNFQEVGVVVCFVALMLVPLAWAWRTGPAEFVVMLGVVWVSAGCLSVLLRPAFDSRPGPGRRFTCSNNLKQIALALHNYHDVYGTFPPAYIADAAGKPMHSWRVLILPFIEQQNLYDQYDFSEPWDGLHNRKLHDKVVDIYCCPSCAENQPRTETNYVVVIGPQTMWPGDKATKIVDVKDGMSNTLMVVEVRDSGIHWMEPRDLHMLQMPLAINPPRGQGISSRHPNVAQAALADGSVRALRHETPPETIEALLTIAGGEPIGEY